MLFNNQDFPDTSHINLIKKKYDLGPGTQQIIDLTLQHQIELKKLKFEY